MAGFETDPDRFVQFENNDEGYLGWLTAHPNGFVVNSAKTPGPNYLVLHRASCKHINSPNRTNWTTTDLIKTCSQSIDELRRWARDEVLGELQPCGACKPGLERAATAISSSTESAAETKIASQTHPVSQPTIASAQGSRQIPDTISTGCPELDLVWKKFAQQIVCSPILIPDTEDDLNWHAFLGHSLDMQGFRAAEFVGVDALTKPAPGFVPLKTIGIGVTELGQLWEVDAIRDYLLNATKGQPLSATFDLLEAIGGSVGKSLAEAFRTFGRCRFRSTVRACLQNCAALKDHGYSFRRWLQSECFKLGVSTFPPTDFRAKTRLRSMPLEMALRYRLEQTFYQVGPALAAYMLCDWQLWLWNNGRTGAFANFKLDSFHEEFVKRFGRGRIPPDEQGFADWWLSLYPDLPPRLANECIWLGLEHKIV